MWCDNLNCLNARKRGGLIVSERERKWMGEKQTDEVYVIHYCYLILRDWIEKKKSIKRENWRERSKEKETMRERKRHKKEKERTR